jgi:D-serine deaminase-like pyridoxal phosphate-dependent protein
MAGIEHIAAPDLRIGQPLSKLDTPTLLLDLVACDENLAKMGAFFRNRPAKLRPHFKNHKCVNLAKRQIAAGAIGMTCAKLGEAEVLVEHGFQDILIANQIVGEAKMTRLAQLGKRARVAVAIDHLEQATAISKAASAVGAVIPLLIEVDIGMGRCGVEAGAPTVKLAQQLVHLSGVRFAGLQAFEGHLVNVLDREERNAKVRAAMKLAIDTRHEMQAAGIDVDCLSGCSSATYDSSGILEGIDEVQAGTYATMDRQYKRLVPEFQIALSVLVSVISRPGPGRAVLDVGVKGAGSEFGVPAIRDFPDVQIPFFLSEEHAMVRNAPDWSIGQTLHLIPSHSCTTCNLYREIVVHEKGCVVDVWPIEASGRLS